MNLDEILALAEKADETAMQYLQCAGDYNSVRDEHFYHAAIQHYKDSVLKEVGEPVCYLYKDHEGSYRQAHDLQFKDAHTPVFTSDQLIAARKPLEEEIERLKAELAKYRDAPCVAYATTNEEDDLTMLFFDAVEARKYSGDDEPIKLIVKPGE